MAREESIMTAADIQKITRPLSINQVWIGTSVLVSVLVAITSLFGIFVKTTYSLETPAWAIQAIGQDCANLVVVILLLISTFFVLNNSLKAYLVWLGIYLYLLYAFMIYTFSVHFQFLFLAYVLILGLSFYTLIGGLLSVDLDMISPSLMGNTRAGAVSIFLFGIGVLFSLLWLSEIIPNLVAGTIPRSLVDTQLWVNPVHVLDLALLLPGMIITSFLLWKGKILGYVMAVPMLVFAATMGLGIIAMFILSAREGMSFPIPAAIMVGTIIVLSTAFSFLFCKEIPEN
jgi:hypothetical protein